MDYEFKLLAGKVSIVFALILCFSACSICCCGCILNMFSRKPTKHNPGYSFTISKYATITPAELHEFNAVTGTLPQSTGYCCTRKKLPLGVIPRTKVFIYEFSADADHHAISKLLQFILYIGNVAKVSDTIIIKITSSGGSAQAYEHAYSQLYALRSKGIILVAMIDTIAASGGYMLAAACNEIIAAETATIGSIGVTATLSTFGETLRTLGVKSTVFESSTSKHPYDPRVDMTPEQETIIRKDLDDTFQNFKQIVLRRGKITKEAEAFSAKTFYAPDAKCIGLIDQIEISTDAIAKYREFHDIYSIYVNEPVDFSFGLSEWLKMSILHMFSAKYTKHV